MNYLAHLHTADQADSSLTGNLLGDFRRGADLAALPDHLLEGIQLHQFVDQFVDAHPISVAFRSSALPGKRRFAGIAQDILMDYWLANKWHHVCAEPIDLFCLRVVQQLARDKAYCPDQMQPLIASLQRHNWLPEMATEEGVRQAFASLKRRWRFGHYLQPFVDHLPTLLEQTESVFDELYPDLLIAVENRQKKTGLVPVHNRS